MATSEAKKIKKQETLVRLASFLIRPDCVYFDCHNVDASTVFDKTCPILRDDSIQFTFCVGPQSLSNKVQWFFDLTEGL